MDNSEILGLPFIMPQQAQKHVTHNEAVQMLDVIIQLSVISDVISHPPAEPINGERYIIPDTASGEWAGNELQIAAFQNSAWSFFAPQIGWTAWIESSGNHMTWDGKIWKAMEQGDGAFPTDILGVNAEADNQNRLTVKTDSVLFSQDDITPGSGDIRTVLNKASETNTASFLFQDNFSGRAEIGLIGDNNFRSKPVRMVQVLTIPLSLMPSKIISALARINRKHRFTFKAGMPVFP